MRLGRGFLAGAGAVALTFSLVLAARAAATPSDFTLIGASEQETIYIFNSVPVSCMDFQAASDTYVWTANLTKIGGDITEDLANNAIASAFISGSCTAFNNVTNTLFIPPGGAYIHVDPAGLVNADFSGAVPDFNTVNNSNDVNLPFFDNIVFHLVFNPNGVTTGGLAPNSGTMRVTGNANLCGAVTSGQTQCLLFDLNFGPGEDHTDYGCICVPPSIVEIDITDTGIIP